MGHTEEAVAQIWGTAPKPRGEGVGAWIKYHLIAIRSSYRSQFVCAEVGCPQTPTTLFGNPTSAYCRLHQSDGARQRRIAAARGTEIAPKALELTPWPVVPESDLQEQTQSA